MVAKIKGKPVRKILVTGAAGMLGSDLCAELSRAHNVTGLDISESAAFIRCDITDKEKVVKVILSRKPDMIIHAAAWTDVDGCEREPDKARRVNEEGTRNVARAAKLLDATLIYISTDFVFDGSGRTPYTEKDAPNPQNVYSESKLRGELIAGELDRYVIIRSGWLYGPSGKNFVNTILNKSKKNKKLEVVDDQRGSPTYTKDLAKGICKLSEISLRWAAGGKRKVKEKAPKGIYHITNSGAVSWFDYTKEILDIAGIKGIEVIPITAGRLGRPANRPAFSVLDNTKFEKTAGFRMRPWREALKDYLCGKTISRH